MFLDLKFHDIPNTVAGAVAAATRLGAWMVNVHAAGGVDMMRAARDAARGDRGSRGPAAAARDRRHRPDEPGPGGDRPRGRSARPVLDQVDRLAALAQERGSTASSPRRRKPRRLREARGPEFVIVTPGIRAAAPAGRSAEPTTRRGR